MIQTSTTSSPQITVTKMELGGHEVSVPVGLSDLLNDSGAWSLKKQQPQNNYEKTIQKRCGRLVTFLKKKEVLSK